jgi:hypothetical protein
VAREVRVVLTCDVDGAEGEEVGTVRFGFEGEDYEIEYFFSLRNVIFGRCPSHLDIPCHICGLSSWS